MATNKQDKELNELLTKLFDIQETVGCKPKTSAADKRNRAENGGGANAMGKGRKAKKAGSRFLELKSSIVERLRTLQKLLEEEDERNRGGTGLNFSVAHGNNPKEVIARQAAMREELRMATEEWEELDSLYKNEARKRKSKFTQEELDFQQTLVQRLGAELEKAKALQGKGYARTGTGRDSDSAALNTQALNIIDMDDGDGFLGGGAGSALGNGNGQDNGGVELTQQQHLQLQTINDRDKEFDQELDQIGEGIQDLSELAQMQNEEVRRQNLMLDNVGQKIDDAQEHITTVNSKMKDTLEEVRAADKLCVDVMCIVLMVGLAAALYKMIVSGGF